LIVFHQTEGVIPQRVGGDIRYQLSRYSSLVPVNIGGHYGPQIGQVLGGTLTAESLEEPYPVFHAIVSIKKIMDTILPEPEEFGQTAYM
jgi:hypothetical protein